jgi:microcompartment protein CcmK/EutM
MVIGKVVGTVVAPIKHPAFWNYKILVVQPMRLPGAPLDDDLIALDFADAGIGDTVLVNQEGNGTRQLLKDPNAPVRSSIVGIIDSLDIV